MVFKEDAKTRCTACLATCLLYPLLTVFLAGYIHYIDWTIVTYNTSIFYFLFLKRQVSSINYSIDDSSSHVIVDYNLSKNASFGYVHQHPRPINVHKSIISSWIWTAHDLLLFLLFLLLFNQIFALFLFYYIVYWLYAIESFSFRWTFFYKLICRWFL